MNTHKPLLLMDVDGPLSPFNLKMDHGSPTRGYVRHVMRPRGYEALPPGTVEIRDHGWDRRYDMNGMPRSKHRPGDPLLVDLHPDHGPALRALTHVYDMVWATTWVDEANTFIGSTLGLPEGLPHIPFAEDDMGNQTRLGRNGSWKTPHILGWLHAHHPGRAWAWVDDQLNRYDRAYVNMFYEFKTTTPNLLLRVDRNIGLRPADFDQLHDFAATC